MPESVPNRINFVYTCDESFFTQMAVSIDSIIDHFDEWDTYRLTFYVVQIDFRNEQKEWLEKMVGKRHPAASVVFYDYAKRDMFRYCRYKAVEVVTLLYYLPNFFPLLNRVIFVDADTIFIQSIGRLWRTELGHNWIGTTPAILDDDSLAEYNKSTTGSFWSADQTLNAGLIILDLDLMRKLDVTRILEEWTERHQRILCLPEQEAIGFNFPNRKTIDHEWNWRGVLGWSEPFWAAKSRSTWERYLLLKPAMIHFQGPLRPADTVVNSKYFAMWSARYRALGLPPLKLNRVRFIDFAFLMRVKKRGFWRWRGTTLNVLYRFPHMLKCAFYYMLYLQSPTKFRFPLVEPFESPVMERRFKSKKS